MIHKIEKYLDTYEKKDLLRFLTCGSVDDGKSTLIGCLLYESKLIFEDQLAALKRDSHIKGSAENQIDYALLMDGLKAEREQGITIDVAYRYFSTPKRKFIIADCPGHEQYTRNMVTGASHSDLAIILIDARNGITTQTKRHAFIISLLGLQHIVIAVNKMDLINYDQKRFEDIQEEFKILAKSLNMQQVYFIPMSALKGENVVSRSLKMPYYTGPALLELLDTVNVNDTRNLKDFRFNVQYVIRPNLNFRGFAGTLSSGIVYPGDEICILPSQKKSYIKEIQIAEEKLPYAFSPQTVTLTLTDEIDISAGDMIVHPHNQPIQTTLFHAHLIWMDEETLIPGKSYLLHYGSQFTKMRVKEIIYKTDINTFQKINTPTLELNEIAEVIIETTTPVFLENYQKNKENGCFILIDFITNATAGTGLFITPLAKEKQIRQNTDTFLKGSIHPKERLLKSSNFGCCLFIAGENALELGRAVERQLFMINKNVYLLSRQDKPNTLVAETEDISKIGVCFKEAGFIFITTTSALQEVDLLFIHKMDARLAVIDMPDVKADLHLIRTHSCEKKVNKILSFLGFQE